MDLDDLRLKVLFFGVWGGPGDHRDGGHFLYLPGGRRCREERLPTSLQTPDGCYCRGVDPKDHYARTLPETEGICRINFVDGWTILSFWDRSGADKRSACNSNFLAFGRHPFEDMRTLIAREYPGLQARWTFPLVLEGPDVAPSDRCVFCESSKAPNPQPPTWKTRGHLTCNYHLAGVLVRDGVNQVEAVA